jgi:glycosyltransferase involved in cell wall biosynthesis
MIKFSILVPTVPNRLYTFYPRLITSLQEQTKNRDDIEILGFYDNKKRSVGQKRNALLNLAQGEFLTFIDDDDRIAEDYIQSIMDTIYANPTADCIVFDCITTINVTEKTTYSKYSKDFEYSEIGDQWRGKPAHTMVWKSSIAKKHMFPNINNGEDVNWVVRACKEIQNEVRIDKVLYYYDFNSKSTETR